LSLELSRKAEKLAKLILISRADLKKKYFALKKFGQVSVKRLFMHRTDMFSNLVTMCHYTLLMKEIP
jgi:hypothetical protein